MPKKTAKPLKKRRQSKAYTAEERENQLIALSYDLVEQRLRDGTATAAETVHFLKLGSSREKVEREGMRLKQEYEKAKTETLMSQKSAEDLYANAIRAFGRYSGHEDEDDYDDEDY